MSESTKVVVMSSDELRNIIRDAVADAFKAQANGQRDIAEKDWLKAKEASLLYGLPKTWFEERGRAGEIARTKPGRYTLFKKRDIEEYLEKHKKNNGGT